MDWDEASLRKGPLFSHERVYLLESTMDLKKGRNEGDLLHEFPDVMLLGMM